MNEEYKAMNNKLHAPATLANRVNRLVKMPAHPIYRARVPAIILAAGCMALILVGAGVYFKTTHTVFGTAVQESVPKKEKPNGTTEMWSTQDLTLPEGTIDYFVLGELGEAEELNSGLLLMNDGRVLLRETGHDDKDLTDAFAVLPTAEFSYAPRNDQGATDDTLTGTVLAECNFNCEVNGETRAVTLTRLCDQDGNIGYAVQYEGLDGVGILYNPLGFNAGCAIDYVLGLGGGRNQID